VTEHDIPWILDRYRERANSSLVLLASIFGFSESEFRVWLHSNALYLDQKNDDSLLIHVVEIDKHIGTARIGLCAERGYPAEGGFLRQCLSVFHVPRLLCNVFEEEGTEMRLLGQAGFQREAVFREHVFAQGGYRNVLVYGRCEVTP
jgi:hypothetical protein